MLMSLTSAQQLWSSPTMIAKLAERIAQDMSDYIWRLRHYLCRQKLPKTKEGVALAIKAAREGKTPVIIADHSDRTGGSTHILEELIKQGQKIFVWLP